ncbi:MAG: hypothetical protein HKP10_06040 [Kiritimatiellales bacterium]|nr:hypothetical protein [Kiritimatiellales bacterium]
MKKSGLIVATALSILALPSHGQSVADQLKVADCNFKILYEGEEVQVQRQMITLRAVSESEEVKIENNYFKIHSAAYRAYHLEFSYSGDLIDYNDVGYVEFYNRQNKRIHIADLEKDSRRISESEKRMPQKVRYFAISLEDTPLLLLDEVSYINIQD